jgi:localization factor PodJL
MNSRVSWSVDGIDPSIRDRAEAAARRAGVSLSDWLNSAIGETPMPDFRNPAEHRLPSPTREVADIHQRLDTITRQIERISQPPPRSDGAREHGVAHQLNDAIARLDARLSQISNPQAARQTQDRQSQERQRQTDAVERAAGQVYRPSPPLSPASFDSAIAEIAARQSELDAPAPRPAPPRSAPPTVPIAAAAAVSTPAGPDFSSLERHLLKITSQIEALQRPDHLEQSIAAFRHELSEIRAAITEAMPRRAIESIEAEVRSLARRIDDNRQSAIDGQALANIERALAEIRGVLRSLTPAEQLAGYDEAIRNLGAKLDTILRASDDPKTVQQLESAIAALRAIVANVASTDALARLSGDLHQLSAKVDQLTRASASGDSFAALEQRIAALTSALEARERPHHEDHSAQIESSLRGLSDRIDRLQVGSDGASAVAHLEQRVATLLERLEASSEHRGGHLGRVEDGLQDILRHLERQHDAFAALASSGGRPSEARDDGLIELVKRELSDIRFSQSETERHTQDSLEAVHSTLGHVVDRLATIEGDLRAVRTGPPQPAAAPAAMPAPAAVAAPPMAMTPQPRPELPNPAAAQEAFAAAPREFHASEPAPQAAPAPPLPISEILLPQGGAPRPALAPDLPPDHPLEPGTRPGTRAASPSERIAASESAISEIPAAPREPVSSSSFIAAARRAAQAAAAQSANDRPGRASAKAAGGKAASDKAKGKQDAARQPSTVTSKIRSLLVGASVVVIVLGSFKMALTLLDNSGLMRSYFAEHARPVPVPASPAAGSAARRATADPSRPSMTSSTPIDRQSYNAAPNAPAAASAAIPQAPAAPATASSDVTGTISPAAAATHPLTLATIQIPQGEKLPEAIGGPVLRAAALKGDASAAYEIGARFAEGKGVPQNPEEAAKWYGRAAQAGVIPAVFRLGTLYEKGIGVKKDVDIARGYYLQAAERGNAKAMHNLAVLAADGGNKGPDYKTAAEWFRKAADHGVADSQFNLGILYARGIGVEQNLAESFKWFSLAAAHGDADSAHKRDDIAKRLDPQSLAAAKLAVQSFAVEPQPNEAVNVPVPPGGWDAASVPAASPKPAVRPVATRRTASR